MSKTGLDCIYNCVTQGTRNIDTTACDSRTLIITKNKNLVATDVAYNIPIGGYISFSPNVSTNRKTYRLKRLPLSSESALVAHPNFPAVIGSQLRIYTKAIYDSIGSFTLAVQFNPTSPLGSTMWELCEEPPTIPHTIDYLGKFLTFTENYCRTCKMPEVIKEDDTIPQISGTITVGGVIITINNQDFE